MIRAIFFMLIFICSFLVFCIGYAILDAFTINLHDTGEKVSKKVKKEMKKQERADKKIKKLRDKADYLVYVTYYFGKQNSRLWYPRDND